MKPVISSERASDDAERPSADIISESIPLVIIGRNKNGCWVAVDADTRTGGLFIFKQSAVRFAEKRAKKKRVAKMFVSKPLELKGRNRGNPFAFLVPLIAGGLNFSPRLTSAWPTSRSNQR